MNNQEYEQQRHDSWISFKTETMFKVDEDAFKAAFDRAYALGRKKETITREDVEKAAEAFATPLMGNAGLFTREQVKELLVKFARIFLGKREKDADTVIQGWVARDLDGEVFLYENKPKRGDGEWLGRISSEFDFQQLKWGSDPIEVEIIIKRKKNG